MVFRGLPRACWEFFFTFAWLGQTPAQSQDWNGRQTWDSDRRVTVNNIQVMLVCGRPGDRGGGTETPAASVPRHKALQCRPGTPGILKYVIRGRSFLRKGIELSNTVS